MKNRLIIILSIIHFVAFGQTSFDDIDSSLIKKWNPKFEIEYQAAYHFGDSEWETKLILIASLDKWYAQIESGSWSGSGSNLAWVYSYENLTNVKVDGNKFYSDKTNGEFVYYDGKDGRIKGLKIYDSWSGEEGFEIGHRFNSIQSFYSGKFPQASYRLLSIEELRDMSINDLKIMRNEIFARYGYKFKTGGKMDSYFQQQDWYKKQHDNVNDFLTDLEKENIKLIQKVENE
jgi:hypothetical protein